MISKKALDGIARNLEKLPVIKAEAEEAMRAKAALRARRSFSSAHDGEGRPRKRRPAVPNVDAEWARVAYFRARFQLSRFQLDGMVKRGEVAMKLIGERRFWRIADVERVFGDGGAK